MSHITFIRTCKSILFKSQCFLRPTTDILCISRALCDFRSTQGYNVQPISITKTSEFEPVQSEPTQPVQSEPTPDHSVSSSAPVNSSNDTTSTSNIVTPIETDIQQPDSMEGAVAKVTDLENGQMKEVELDGKKILLVKEDGQFYATGNKCTHYGAALSKGTYCKGIVRCPWHGACFNVKTGDIEDFPGLDSIQTFKTEIRGEDVYVQANPKAFENFRRVKPMVKRDENNVKTVALVGGGPSTLVCAETLRQEGFTGRIIFVSRESVLPYDRIKLSKAMSITAEEIRLRKQEFFDENGIELLLGKEVTSVAPSEKFILLNDGQKVTFDSLVIGTGGKPRSLPIPGVDLENIYMLRTPKDANAIAENGKDKNVVIVGSSFIGMEVASFLAGKALSVHVVDLIKVPFELTLGGILGSFMQKLHESKGVQFHFGTSVKEFRGQDGKVVEAELANGEVLKADVCVMGVGVVPATDFLKDSGINMTARGFIPVNKNMQTNLSGIYAVGDIVEFPLFTEGDKAVNIQHWQMAHKHGQIAGLNLAGKSQEIHSVPYFWTAQYGKNVRYTGYGVAYDDIVLHGNVDDSKFVAFYTKEDRVVAVASLGWDPIVSQAAELMSKGGTINKDEIKSVPDSWVSRLCHL